MKIEVRPAVRADSDAICDAHVASWRAGYAHIFPSSILDASEFDSSRRERWRAWTHSPTPDRLLNVGALEGRVVGFCLTGHLDDPSVNDDMCGVRDDPDSTELHGLYVHPDAWGSGVADALMSAGLEHLRSLGSDRAILWTLGDAHRARRFYERSGWSATGRIDLWDRYPDHPVDDVEYEITGLSS